MARSRSNRTAKVDLRNQEDDLDLDEIDQFHKNQTEDLSNRAGLNNRHNDDFEMSDEEVLALNNESESEMDDNALYGVENEDDEEEGWGTSKKNYYGADQPQDEEDAKREEEEALRLQKAHLAELGEDDYYEDEDVDEWKQSAKKTEDDLLLTGGIHHESLPDQDPSLLDDGEKLNLLKNWYPEVLPFISELEKYSPELEVLKNITSTGNKIASIKFAALSSYLGTLTAYFALFVGTVDKGKVNLKDHDVVKGILKARELWRLANELDEDNEDEEDDDDEDEDDDDIVSKISSDSTENSLIWQSAGEEFSEDDLNVEINHPRKRKSTESHLSDDEFSVETPVITKPLKKKSKASSDYLEDDTINQVDLVDKQARKKSLRFYTSKIDQQAIKSANYREKYSGDVDIPYKERHFERQQRLSEEARQRGLKATSSSYDPADDFTSDNENDRRTAKSINTAFDEDYYNTVKSASVKRKEGKKASHELAVAAAKEGRLEEIAYENSLADGDKRAINYQILKNKGLTPKRNKDNRNSRVKKRKKYEAAKKKLPSVRQVYKTPTSSYQGEQTGIKKNIIRSVRFAN